MQRERRGFGLAAGGCGLVGCKFLCGSGQVRLERWIGVEPRGAIAGAILPTEARRVEIHIGG